MPSGLIDDHDGMCSRRDDRGDFLQMEVHALGIANGQNQCCPNAPARTDRTIDPSRAGALILWRDGACAAFRPAPRDLGFLSDPGFVLKPNFYGCVGRKLVADLCDFTGEVFLKAAPASGSWA